MFASEDPTLVSLPKLLQDRVFDYFAWSSLEAHPDSTQVAALTDDFEFERVIADPIPPRHGARCKSYDSDEFLQFILSRGAETVIPPRANRKVSRAYDKHVYRERHLVECFINKIKHYCRIFSRFEKIARRYLGFLSFVGALIWLP